MHTAGYAARFFSVDITMCYVLPVMWITSYLHVWRRENGRRMIIDQTDAPGVMQHRGEIWCLPWPCFLAWNISRKCP